MRGELSTSVHKRVEALWRHGTSVGWTDRELLECFVDRRHATSEAAEAAFAAIVDRHGPMVLRTCRRILGDEHEAQDAAQVAFLVLARRARQVGGFRSVGGWLHEVAVRVASKARIAAIRRRVREDRWGRSVAGRVAEGSEPADDPERWAELHEELARLPEAFRAPLVLCDLEGLTQQQAAARLGWPLGTVQSRLARGRARLKSRLVRRGVVPAVGLVGAGMASALAHAEAPAPWVEATTRAAVGFATQRSWAVRAGAGPASADLAWEVLREMGIPRLKIVVAATLVVAVALTSAAALSIPGPKGQPPQPGRAATVPAPAGKPAVPRGPDNLTVRGVVRDDQGRPLARAWVGSDPRPMPDTWDNPRPENIREVRAVFRDANGNVIPPGAVRK
jgi:RNA polymerase sigma factor (sigma-70 family)